MTETTETFEQLWQRLLDEETADVIISRIQFWIDEKLFSDAVTEDAKLILTSLTSKIEENPESALALARAARQALRQIIDESTRKYVANAVENEWDGWRAKLYYAQNPEMRPVNSRYPLEGCVLPVSPVKVAPAVDDDSEI